ncbi:unnamed protein product [Ixodes pacificus]
MTLSEIITCLHTQQSRLFFCLGNTLIGAKLQVRRLTEVIKDSCSRSQEQAWSKWPSDMPRSYCRIPQPSGSCPPAIWNQLALQPPGVAVHPVANRYRCQTLVTAPRKLLFHKKIQNS